MLAPFAQSLEDQSLQLDGGGDGSLAEFSDGDGSGQLGSRGGRWRAQIGGEVRESEIGLVAHAADQRRRGGRHGADDPAGH